MTEEAGEQGGGGKIHSLSIYYSLSRIEKAKQLLLQREFSIAEIASQVGFVDQSHLNRHFKRLIGVTPKMLEQKYKK
ncbi:MAG: helix-turn-helix domain-containing protein [Nostoc sp. CmiVER01]|uniref:helix-turn-helix domain-containing protein n=1 Tax=Nostoc sp. CmiVER01 TaxID=3075384 RepID=UPI003A100E38